MQKIAVGIMAYTIVLTLFVTIRVNMLTAEVDSRDSGEERSAGAVRSPDYSMKRSDTRFASTSVCNPRIAACN